jgi:serine phosphatase RsbU (regulator of sigma subunit)
LVRAGHTLPVLIPGDKRRKIREMEVSGLGIGLTGSENIFKKSVEIKQITLEPSDILVLSSDGVAEAAKPKISASGTEEMEFYGNDRFLALLGELRNQTPKTIVDELTNDLDRFYLKYSRIDDHTFLIIQRTGN